VDYPQARYSLWHWLGWAKQLGYSSFLADHHLTHPQAVKKLRIVPATVAASDPSSLATRRCQSSHGAPKCAWHAMAVNNTRKAPQEGKRVIWLESARK